MAESIITGTIYKTRQDSGTRIVVCTTHYVKWSDFLTVFLQIPVAQAGFCL